MTRFFAPMPCLLYLQKNIDTINETVMNLTFAFSGKRQFQWKKLWEIKVNISNISNI